jgi:hypothetical protein
MSLIDNIRKPRQLRTRQALTAPDVEKQLAAAELVLAEAKQEYAATLFDHHADPDGEGVQQRYTQAAFRLSDATNKVDTLKQILEEAGKRDAEQVERQRRDIRNGQLRAVIKQLGARDEAAKALSDALRAAADAYHKLLDANDRALAACPSDIKLSGVSMHEFQDLKRPHLQRLVTAEMWRVSAAKRGYPNTPGSTALPGAKALNATQEWNPAGVPSLPEAIKQASDFAVEQLTRVLEQGAT